jgi:hypothetical protein
VLPARSSIDPTRTSSCTVRLGADLHSLVAFTELDRVVFLESDRCLEIDILGLVRDAEGARTDDAVDPIAIVDNRLDREK